MRLLAARHDRHRLGQFHAASLRVLARGAQAQAWAATGGELQRGYSGGVPCEGDVGARASHVGIDSRGRGRDG